MTSALGLAIVTWVQLDSIAISSILGLTGAS